MSFEALLTFISVLLAAFAIARPVQRRSVILFIPTWLLFSAILASTVLLVIRDAPLGVKPAFGWSLPLVLFSLTCASFLVLVLALIWSWALWNQAKLTPKNESNIEGLFQAALREHEYDEVERIIRRNRRRLRNLPSSATSVLFHPKMVAALSGSRSLIHLELLADMDFLNSMQHSQNAVDVVVRDPLQSEASPLRAVVLSRYGGLEHPVYSERDNDLVIKTFLKPSWYLWTRADYPLTIAAVEFLESGRYDAAYNAVDERYHARQGVSTRSGCPIYLAIKTQVLAIEAAIQNGVEGDFYITDLSDIFRTLLSRSHTDSWTNPRGYHEYPTPYAYLMYEIIHDLRRLSAEAIRQATSVSETSARIKKPGSVASGLARAWAICTWTIAEDTHGRVSPDFQRVMIEGLLVFLLQINSEPSEIYLSPIYIPINGIDVWRGLFLEELRSMFVEIGASTSRSALRAAFDDLDQGKGYVFNGWDWLEGELFATG